MVELEDAVQMIADARRATPSHRALLVAVSGIDGAGKSYWSAQLVQALQSAGHRAGVVNIDLWLALPAERFDPARPGRNFYERGIRFDQMLADLVRPMQQARSLHANIEAADATMADRYRQRTIALEDLDVLVIEGVFLLKRELRDEIDLRIWIDCTFDTALERALDRGQECLPAREVVRDYHTIYFPAQQIHFEIDEPKACADLIAVNDQRLTYAARASV